MGAPSSSIIAEIFLQSPEDTHRKHLSNKHKIARYFRYVDDILIIYNSNHTDVSNISNNFNTIHHNLKFTAEAESNNKISYLDITIHRTPNNWVTSM
jgi:hypothetical protein